MSNMFDIDYLIRIIEKAPDEGICFDRIAEEADIKISTLWRIRKKKLNPSVQIAKKIFNAIEVIRKRNETNRNQM